MPRHILTAEERRRAAQKTNEKLRASGKRHVFTREERAKGAHAVNRLHATISGARYRPTREECAKGARTVQARMSAGCLACGCPAGHAHHVRGENRCVKCALCPGFIAPPRRYQLTAEDRRKGGLAAAAKRRAARLAAAGVEPCPLDTRPIPATEKLADPKPDLKALGDRLISEMIAEETVEAREQGREPWASIMGEAPGREEVDVKLPLVGTAGAPWPSVDPSWRSALARLRLGPMWINAVARSHRDALRSAKEAGLVEVMSGDFYKLTDKGRQAIGVGVQP